jgi:hypothetical protein
MGKPRKRIQRMSTAGIRPDPSMRSDLHRRRFSGEGQVIVQNLGRDSRERPAPNQGGEYAD